MQQIASANARAQREPFIDLAELFGAAMAIGHHMGTLGQSSEAAAHAGEYILGTALRDLHFGNVDLRAP